MNHRVRFRIMRVPHYGPATVFPFAGITQVKFEG